MMINSVSRHRFSLVFADTERPDVLFMGEREPFRYRDLPDSRQHVVRGGDTWFNLAGRYYEGFARAAGLWWVIADFQPVPCHDPTIALVPGTIVVIPSMRVVQMQVLSPARRNVVP